MSFEVMLRQLGAGFGQTFLIFILTLVFSLPLGMVVYFGRVSKFKPVSWLVKVYISIMRGTPLMLQTILFVGNEHRWIQIDGDLIGLFFKLCSIFCRNLSFGN